MATRWAHPKEGLSTGGLSDHGGLGGNNNAFFAEAHARAEAERRRVSGDSQGGGIGGFLSNLASKIGGGASDLFSMIANFLGMGDAQAPGQQGGPGGPQGGPTNTAVAPSVAEALSQVKAPTTEITGAEHDLRNAKTAALQHAGLDKGVEVGNKKYGFDFSRDQNGGVTLSVRNEAGQVVGQAPVDMSKGELGTRLALQAATEHSRVPGLENAALEKFDAVKPGQKAIRGNDAQLVADATVQRDNVAAAQGTAASDQKNKEALAAMGLDAPMKTKDGQNVSFVIGRDNSNNITLALANGAGEITRPPISITTNVDGNPSREAIKQAAKALTAGDDTVTRVAMGRVDKAMSEGDRSTRIAKELKDDSQRTQVAQLDPKLLQQVQDERARSGAQGPHQNNPDVQSQGVGTGQGGQAAHK